MTALLLAFGIFGHPEIAADIGLIQGATLALFYAFSANARNLILADPSGSTAIRLLQMRLLLAVPLAATAYVLSVGIGATAAPLAVVLIVRRASEWMGEIALARHERLNQPLFVLQTLLAECLSFAFCLLPLLFDLDLTTAAIPWACAPLLATRRLNLSWRDGGVPPSWRSLLPHFGSTAIIGTSVYVFRISIVLLTGKFVAGQLFTAFALGGIIPTVYGQALAPTLAHRFGTAGLPKWLLSIPAAMLLVAGAISAIAIAEPDWLYSFGRSSMFWLAVGLSIAGGAIMTVAAALRTRLIHRADGREVFGPDLLANVLIATCVPFVYYVLGPKALSGLYALSACLSLAFLFGAGRERGLFARRRLQVLFAVGALLILPVFFQIEGGLFRDADFVFETGGAISRLPIPIGVVVLFGGIALLGNYVAASRTMTVLFFTALLFVMTSLVAAQSNSAQEGAKLILIAQFLLPMFGLILGEMYGASTRRPAFELAAIWVLLLIVPAQVVASWMQGYPWLSPKIFIFSIYQHLQYFPMMVVALGLMVTAALWPYARWARIALGALLPLLAIHVVASQSFIAIVALGIGLILFAYAQTGTSQSRITAPLVVVVALMAGVAYWTLVESKWVWTDSDPHAKTPSTQLFSEKLRVGPEAGGQVVKPLGVTQSVEHWKFYTSGVVESPRTFLLGHAKPPERNVHPSAHNYWLDALYNFGMIAILPLLVLLLWTLRTLWRQRVQVMGNPLLLGTAMAATYLLLGENMLKVGMRQPYPGIITFFIWGLLIARLRAAANDEKARGVDQ